MAKKMMAFIIATVMFFITGCSYSQTGIDSLLEPPKLSQQQNEVYAALEASVGKNIKLKYPRKGDFTSAFLINNIDNEPTQEAIVFYEMANNTTATMPLRINVLDQKDGDWVSTYEIGVEANEVEKVSFITSNQKIYIIIGFNLVSKSDKLLKLYSFDDGVLNEVSTTNCSNYEVFDIDGDNASEIITITNWVADAEVKKVRANLNKVTSTGLVTESKTEMDSSVGEYVNIIKSKLWDGRPALYFDGLKGTNTMTTEILAMNSNNKIENLIYTPVEAYNIIGKTFRASRAHCIDLNKDGIYEIPNIKSAPGYEDAEKHQKASLTDWYNYKDGELQLVKTSYIKYNLGYVFTIPDKWTDKVTIEEIINDNEVIFYEYDIESKTKVEKLASFRVVKKTDFDHEFKHKSYNIIEDNGQLVYLYKIYKSESLIPLTISDVENCFNLL